MPCSPDGYGKDYQAHLLEQYKLYVEMADRISARRQTANSFFLTVNTAVIALVSYLSECSGTGGDLLWLIPFAGAVLAYTWYRLVRSYRDLNSAKFKVIHDMEEKLPMAPYDLEWEKVGRGKCPQLYLPFTHIEIWIPWVFFIIHAVAFLTATTVADTVWGSICRIYSCLGQL